MRLFKKLTTFLILIIFFINVSPALANNLWDARGHWAEREVSVLVTKGIVNGYQDGSFRPEKEVTRAQFVKMIIEALGYGDDAKILESVSSPFKDVADKHWAKGHLISAIERGIIGAEGKNFRPDQAIKRVEMTVMVVRALGLRTQAEQKENQDLRFDDSINIPQWAKGYVAVATGLGIITGMPDNTFRPNQTATRAQAAVIIRRMLEQLRGSYDVYGIIRGIDLQKRKLRIVTERQEAEFDLSYDVSVFKNLQAIKPEGLKALDEIGLVLDKNRKVGYIDAFFHSSEGVINSIDSDKRVITYAYQGEIHRSSVKNGAQLFLNGRPTNLEDLQKGDDGYFVYEYTSGSIRTAFITRFNISGRIKVIDKSSNRVTIVLNSSMNKTYLIDEHSIIYRSGNPAALSDIEIGEYINLAVDDSGFIEYGEIQ